MKQFLILIIVLTLSACGSQNVKPLNPSSLEERAQLRWDYLITGDNASAYPFYSPGYRELVSQQQFNQNMQRRTVTWTDAVLQEISECEDDLCVAVVSVSFEVRSGLPGVGVYKSSQLVREKWIKLDGQWYLIPPDR